VVAPDSPVFTPQQLANKTVAVPFYFGTHYIALHMLPVDPFHQLDRLLTFQHDMSKRHP
jgi:hypothetical protein